MVRQEIAELPEWITRQEAATLLNVTDKTIRKMERAGKIKSEPASANRVIVEVDSLLRAALPGLE